jgi:hypothetical protein
VKSRSSWPTTTGKDGRARSNRVEVGRCRSLLLAVALLLCNGCEHGDGPPSVVSVSPASGSGLAQIFTLVYSAPNGFSDLTDVKVLFGPSSDAMDSCYVWYDPVHDALNLADDDAATWTSVSLRSSGSAENSQCRVSAMGSSASGSGAKLTVRLAVVFRRAFAGFKNVYLFAEERQGLSTGFSKKGTWVVPYEVSVFVGQDCILRADFQSAQLSQTTVSRPAGRLDPLQAGPQVTNLPHLVTQ